MSAKHYYEKIEKLFTELRDQVEGGVKDFYTWRETKGIIDPRGLKASTISNLRTDLYSLKDKDAPLDKKNKKKADRLIDEYKKYRVWLAKSIPVEKEQGSFENNFKNCSWFFYYFRQANSGAHLARAILSLEDGKKVTLKSVSDNDETEYEGQFSLWHNRFGVFELQGKTTKKKLSLQAFLGTKQKELALGFYVTSDFETLISGTFVLQQINDKEVENLEPILLSHTTNKEEFNNVLLPIRRFLSLKSRNHFRLPRSIYDKHLLKESIDKYEPNRSAFFFSENRPVVFISSPYEFTSLREKEKQHIIELKNRLEKAFPYLDIEYTEEKEKLDKNSTPEFIHNLERIKRATYFIFISPVSEKPTASIVEMSWALAFSKHVLLCYKRGTIPEILPKLKSSKSSNHAQILTIQFDDFEKDFEEICDRITLEIMNDTQ